MLRLLRQHPLYRHAVHGLLAVTAVLLVRLLATSHGEIEYGAPGTADFIEYWGAGQLLREGENPYDTQRLHRWELRAGFDRDAPLVMYNPPWLLVWVYPLLLLPFHAAALCWLAVSAILTLLAVCLVWRAIVPRPPPHLIAIAWLSALAFPPVLITWNMGQVSSLLLLGVAGFLFFARRDRDFFAGACLALTSIKPHLVYLVWIVAVWWAVRERRWKFFSGVLTLLVPSVAALGVLFPNALLGFQAVLTSPPLYWCTPTLGGVLRLLFFPDTPWLQYAPTLVTGPAVLAYLLLRRPQIDWGSGISPILLLSVATAAYGWSFDQVVLLVPVLEVVGWLLGRPLPPRVCIILILAPLLLIAGGMFAMNFLGFQAQWYFWVPWALAGVYVVAWRMRSSTLRGDAALLRCSERHARGATISECQSPSEAGALSPLPDHTALGQNGKSGCREDYLVRHPVSK